MKSILPTRRADWRHLALVAVLTGLPSVLVAHRGAAAADESALLRSGDPWSANDLIDPASLAQTLAAPSSEKTTVLCVGVASLYKTAHIGGAEYVGAGRSAEGIATLEKTVRGLPRDRAIVLYCGCCPWKDCPNIRPAFAALRRLEFQNVRVLTLPTSFHADWVAAGLPIEKGEAGAPAGSRQEHVHAMGGHVMPFSLTETQHVFEMTDTGGVMRVVARDPKNAEQIRMIQHHLEHEAQLFQSGDFSDPARLHGKEMLGLSELSAAGPKLQLRYAPRSDGGEVVFTAKDIHIISAVHRWFGAQLSDHGADAMAK